jgi:kumamolisin
MWHLLLLAAIGALVVAGCGGASHRPASERGRAAKGSEPVYGRRLGALSRGQIRFAFTLRLHQGKLDQYLRHASPGPGLSAREFGARFGPTDRDLARLHQVMRRLGLVDAHLYPQRTAMLVKTSVANMRTLFALHFERYRLSSGVPYFAPMGQPHLPAALTPYVSGLADLSSRPVPPADIPSSGLTPRLTAAAYDVAPLWKAGIKGQGQTIAVASDFGAINPSDIPAFAHATGTPVPHIEIKPVDGGSTYSDQAGSDQEVDQDLQIVAGIAPDASIIDYDGSDGSHTPQPSFGHSLADIYNQIEQDGQAKIVSTSYGLCEPVLSQQSPGDQALIDNSLKALEASSVTVFVASGDSGAYGCLHNLNIEPGSSIPAAFDRLAAAAPSTSPYVVAVGGTRLELRANGSYLAESAWGDPLAREGGTGGVSETEPRPSWQQGPGVVEAGRNPADHRQVPDVSGPADPNSAFEICLTLPGHSSPQCLSTGNGTSAATPFWAASMLLVQQYAEKHGAARLARCFASPILYDLAARHQPVPAFHQVTLGNNGYYAATPHWNYATGLGSPDVFNLAQDYASFLRNRSSNSCPF